MTKLVGSSTFTYKKGVKNISVVNLLLNKGVVDNHYLQNLSHISEGGA